MLLIALSAGLVCGVIVVAFFIALDQVATTAPTTGAWMAPPVKTTFIKRLEGMARPVASRLTARAAGQLRQKLSRAGDPGNLTIRASDEASLQNGAHHETEVRR